MAGSYTKKEFGAGPEEQTLLKDSNGTRIVATKGNSGTRSLMVTGECSSLLGILLLFCHFIFSGCIPAQTSL